MALEKAKVLVVSSVKGGTGKTTTVLNLAGIYSLENKKVLIMDLDLFSGGIAASLNVSDSQDIYKLIDDFNNNRFVSIEPYLVKYNKEIDVLAAPRDPRLASKINGKYFSLVLSKVIYRYDIILIDTNHFMNDINLMALDASDQVLYVITNDPIDLKNMATRVALHKNIEQNDYKIVLNEAHDTQRDYFTKYDIKNILNDNIDYTIPKSFYIKNIDKYVLDGNILTLNKQIQTKHKKAMESFKMIASALIKEKK